ncbi:MAG: hypothetical protein KAR45_20555, partial [Desulfobacteraceae bacterium]|nr:hypothetical protein [Desulfobacteraceae bacterium]
MSNKNTIARIQPNETFNSDPVEISVPAAAPDELICRLEIKNIYYHHAREDSIKLTGMSTTQDVMLIDTAYKGNVTSVDPKSSNGDTDIIISGQAIDRATDQPLGNVNLNLVIMNNGFERQTIVVTDETGEFEYNFIPLKGESGEYRVCAIHPDLLYRPIQETFVISKVRLNYTNVQLNISRNHKKKVTLKATTGENTIVNHLGFQYRAEDQENKTMPKGVFVTCADPVLQLYPKTTKDVAFTIHADNTSDDKVTIVLRLVSDESPDGWLKVIVKAHFSEASPVLNFVPDHVETGTSRDNSVTEIVTLTNSGHADMEHVTLRIVNQDGSPAPSWVYITSDRTPGILAPQSDLDVNIMFAPTADIMEDDYAFYLRIKSS